MRHFYLAFITFLCLTETITAQNTMRREDKIKVVVNGDTLRNPWAGGLHAPQFNELDIDGDGHDDLMVFNRGILASSPSSNGFKLLTFKNNGTPNQVDYTYKPEWEALFPSLVFWVKVADMNCDGIPDLLSANQSQYAFFNWYEGFRNANGLLYFEYRDTLRTSNAFAPVALQRADYPGVSDVDRDGDLDFINVDTDFGIFTYYKNVAAQTLGCNDTIGYEVAAYCWGEVNLPASGVQTGFMCPFSPRPIGGNGGSGRHNGGAALVIDLDGDGDDDLIYGEVDKTNLFAVYNSGDHTYAIVDSVDANFPSYDTPARITYYPLAFALDANNDGKKDIIVAPNEATNCASKNTTLFYQNISPNDSVKLHLVQRDFLEGDMVELGQGTFPVFVDYNGDTLVDLVVGNFGYYRDSMVQSAQLALFINIGTAQTPIFELVDEDWLGFGALYPTDTFKALKPTFGDLDGDGDLDLLIGDAKGELTYFENTAGPGNPMVFAAPVRQYAGINAGVYAAPYIYDVNGDNVPDLLIGVRSGFVRYFENRGTSTAPQFDAVATNPTFGNINVSTMLSLYGYANPLVTTLDSTATRYVLSGNEEGRVYGYVFDSDSIYGGSFAQVFDYYANIDAGERTVITVADITHDGKPEMIVGNHRGGLEFYTLSDTIEDIIGIADLAENPLKCDLYPNPTNGEVFLSIQGIQPIRPLAVAIYGLLGNRLLHTETLPLADSWAGQLSVAHLRAGVYILHVAQGPYFKTVKLIKQ